jgi:cation diffusion facilitator family transporter
MDQKNMLRKKLSKQEGWVSIILNTLLFALKYWAGIVSGSLALMADAWHTLSDSLSSLFVLVSAKISFKKPDKEHPFGHGRYELVTSIFIGILLILVGLNFVKEGVAKFVERQEAQYGLIAIVVTIISIILKEALAQYAFWAGKKVDSDALRADAWHHRSDALSSIVILVGIFVGRAIWWIDALLSVVVALFILYAAYKIIAQSISSILGEDADPNLEEKLNVLAKQVTGLDLDVHHIHLHNYVTHRELTFHVCLDPTLTISEAHEQLLVFEDQIRKQLDAEPTIHIDPWDVERE